MECCVRNQQKILMCDYRLWLVWRQSFRHHFLEAANEFPSPHLIIVSVLLHLEITDIMWCKLENKSSTQYSWIRMVIIPVYVLHRNKSFNFQYNYLIISSVMKMIELEGKKVQRDLWVCVPAYTQFLTCVGASDIPHQQHDLKESYQVQNFGLCLVFPSCIKLNVYVGLNQCLCHQLLFSCH